MQTISACLGQCRACTLGKVVVPGSKRIWRRSEFSKVVQPLSYASRSTLSDNGQINARRAKEERGI